MRAQATARNERLGAGRWIEPARLPPATVTTAHELTTTDGATVTGLLRTVPGARTVVCLVHPRQDFSHHAMVPELLSRGAAVWTQGTRSVNNDLALVHEQALLDVAAGQLHLREAGWEHVVTLGHSGGGTLLALYHEQAGLPPGERASQAPGGRPVDLAGAVMPVPDGALFLAPHPGQGALLLRLVDPSVTDESDPLSVDPALDPYESANGFAPPGESSTYGSAFVERYRAGQAARIARIDAVARQRASDAAAARRRAKVSGEVADRRAALVPRTVTVFRTDADLRSVDLTMDPNERPYGSLFGRRPDLTNYGQLGFGRSSTPEAWLSTWSANTTRADFLRCAPAVLAPTLLIGLSADQACFPADLVAMEAALGARDLTVQQVRGTHFGGPVADGEPTGISLAGVEIAAWLSGRHPLADRTG